MNSKNHARWLICGLSAVILITGFLAVAICRNRQISVDAATGISITVNVEWDDGGDIDGIRPENFTVDIYKDNVKYKTLTFSSADGSGGTWSKTMPGLAGTASQYTAKVTAPDGYTAQVTALSVAKMIMVDLSHTPVTRKDITIKSVWDDAGNANDLRPAEQTVQLLRNGTVFQTIKLAAGDSWSYTVSNLPMADPVTRASYTYSVKESSIPKGYTASVSGSATAGFTVTHKHTPEPRTNGTIVVEADWQDGNNVDGHRPDELIVDVLRDGTKVKSVTLNASNEWSATVTGLVDMAMDGHFYQYTLNGQNVSAVYTSVVETTTMPLAKSGHSHSWVEQKIQGAWIPNLVIVDDYEDRYVVTADKHKCYNCEYETLNAQDMAKHSEEYIHGWDIIPVWSLQSVKVGSHTEDHGHYEEYAGYYTCSCEVNTSAIVNKLTLVNAYVPIVKHDMDINVIWDDINDKDKIRPADVQTEILRNNSHYSYITLNAANNWIQTVKDLPGSDGNGTTYTYTLAKPSAPAGYTVEVYDGSIYFSHTPVKRISLPISASWPENGNRPDSLEVNVLRNGVSYDTVTLNAGNDWKTQLDNLKISDPRTGQPFDYTLADVIAPAGYTVSVSGSVITFTNIPISYIELPIAINWQDDGNKDGIRKSVSVKVLQDSTEFDIIELNEGNRYKRTVSVPETDVFGHVYDYTAALSNMLPGYSSSIDDFDITLTHVPVERRDLTVKIDWQDGEDKDGVRPSEPILVNATCDGNVIETMTLNSDNRWTDVIADRMVSDPVSGRAYDYEVNIPDIPGYEITADGLTLKCVHNPVPRISFTVESVWNDGDNIDGMRPGSVDIEVLRNGEHYETVTLDEGCWQKEFDGLFAKNPVTGEAYTYTVFEPDVPNRYTATVSGFTVTNSYMPVDRISVITQIRWDDAENADGRRPENVTVSLLQNGTQIGTAVLNNGNNWQYEFMGLQKSDPRTGKVYTYTVSEPDVPDGYEAVVDGYTITNRHVPAAKSAVVVSVKWIDGNNVDDIRPKSLSVRLLRDGVELNTVMLKENDWTYVFRDMPMTNPDTGSPYVYTAELTDEVPGYSIVVDGYIITCTHKPVSRPPVVVEIDWEDGDNVDEIRPASMSVDVFRDGTRIDTVELNRGDDWTHTLNGLPETDPKTGHKYNYTVSAANQNGYSQASDGTVLTFTHDPVNRITVTAGVMWNDGGNIDGIRPSSISAVLLKDGKCVADIILEKNGWSYSFTNMPETDPLTGEKHAYTVKIDDVPAGYEVSAEGLELEYTHDPVERISFTVKAEWNDGDDVDKKRPESLGISLFRNGSPFGTLRLTPDAEWRHEVKGLMGSDPRTGEEYEYSIEVTGMPEDYDISVDEYTVTCSYEPIPRISFVAKVLWDDANDWDKKRPENIEICILRDDEQFDSRIVSDNTGWMRPYDGLEALDEDGGAYRYSLDIPEVPDGYELEIDGFTATLKHNVTVVGPEPPAPPKTVSVTVTCRWDDDGDSDGMRPETVNIELYRNDVLYDTASINKMSGWSCTFEDLPEMDGSGKPYLYTVDETGLPDGYHVTVDGYKITNTYEPPVVPPVVPLTGFTIRVDWDDADDKDGLRPEEIHIPVYRNGEDFATAVLCEITGWSYSYEGLPAADADGIEYEYKITVPEIKGYTASADGYDISYNHVPEIPEQPEAPTTGFTVKAVWDEENNSDRQRPDETNIDILQNGVVLRRVTLASSSGWALDVGGLPKLDDDDREYEYGIRAVDVEGYGISVSGFTVTYKSIPEEPDVPEKPEKPEVQPARFIIRAVWDDGDDKDGLRPNSVEIIILQNGTEASRAVLNAGNGWSYECVSLPSTDAYGNEYRYTIRATDIPGYTMRVNGFEVSYKHTPANTPSGTPNVKPDWNDHNNQNHGTSNQGSTNQGSTNNGTSNNGTVNNGTTNRGTTSQSTMNNSTVNQSTANRGGNTSQNTGQNTGQNKTGTSEIVKTGDDTFLLATVIGLVILSGSAFLFFTDTQKGRRLARQMKEHFTKK